MEKATLSSGCFWCADAIFRRLKGVTSVTSGYTNSNIHNPTYDQIHSRESSGVESIQIEFDPSVIPFEKLLDIFWHTHDPTTLNRQNYDVGEEYKSAIFYMSDSQKEIAERSKETEDKSGRFKDPIVTSIEKFENFYPAGKEHQDFYEKYKNSPYCIFVIDPKIAKLLKEYSKDIKENYKV